MAQSKQTCFIFFLLVFVLFFVFVFVFSFFRESHLKPLVDALAVELVAARQNSHHLIKIIIIC